MMHLNAQQNAYPLEFNEKNYKIQTFVFDGKEYKVRAYENIIYVANPVDTAYQKMNIYIPEEYYQKKKINGHTKETAPIFFPNAVGGYMPAYPMTLNDKRKGPQGRRNEAGNQRPDAPPHGDKKKQSAIHYALSKGYIVASAGARGRNLKNSKGDYTGKAPAGLIDLKAAICYLRFNDKLIPGDKEKIISNGTSAGGAMSTLLGATGNSKDYAPYLEDIGAANMPDHVFAVSAYCPITDLNHADCAYEWQFNGVNTYEPRMMDFIEGKKPEPNASNVLTPNQIQVSDQLKALFPMYVNALELQDEKGNFLTMDQDGNGTFKNYIIELLKASAEKAMHKGKDLSKLTWLKVSDKKVKDFDFDGYVQNMKRMKTPPAFDGFDLETPENHLFGTANVNAQHFTPYSSENSPIITPMADSKIIDMMNPMNYVGTRKSNPSNFWHIRFGSVDNNISIATEVLLATYLRNKGYDVNFEIAWGIPHTGDYDLKELFEWMDKIIKK